MKNFILIIFLSLFCLNTAQSQWIVQNSGTNAFIKSACFLDENTGWACADELVLKTSNGGDNWINIPVPGYHSQIYFVDENYGWICGQNGEILRTTDGGSNWTTLVSGTNFHLNDIKFYDRNTGFIVGFGRTFKKTTNGGDSWVNVLAPGTYPSLHSIYIKDADHIYATADFSYIYNTSDGGTTWDSLTVGMENPFFSIYFPTVDKGWVLGCCGMYFKTTDGGNSWTPETYLTPGFSIYSADFINESTGWMSADGGYIMRTTNGGDTWDSLYSGTQNSLRTIQFVNDSTGWVVGYDGLIMKTTNGGGQGWSVGIHSISGEIPSKYKLNQNYPNPFNPTTKISFEIPEASDVKLTIYNMLGREMSVLIEQKLAGGSYEYLYNASDLNSGIYFYKITAHGFTQTKKMVLLK